MKKPRSLEVGDALRASRDTQAIARANARMRGEYKCGGSVECSPACPDHPNYHHRHVVQRFLQSHSTETFGTDWLSRYLGIPKDELELICVDLIIEGSVSRPEATHYVQGVAVDWAAVHEGIATRPEWAK